MFQTYICSCNELELNNIVLCCNSRLVVARAVKTTHVVLEGAVVCFEALKVVRHEPRLGRHRLVRRLSAPRLLPSLSLGTVEVFDFRFVLANVAPLVVAVHHALARTAVGLVTVSEGGKEGSKRDVHNAAARSTCACRPRQSCACLSHGRSRDTFVPRRKRGWRSRHR